MSNDLPPGIATRVSMKSMPISELSAEIVDDPVITDDHQDNRVLVVGVQWAAIGALIAERILSRLVDKLIDEMFGANSPDLEQLLQKYVQIIGAVLQHQLDERDMRKMAEKARSIQSLFGLYRHGHPADILGRVFFNAHDLTFAAESFTFRAASTFAIAGGLELVALHEREKKDPSQKGSLIDRAKQLVHTSDSFRPSLEKYNSGRFGPLEKSPFDSFSWFYTVDGARQLVWPPGGTNPEASSKVRLEHIERERARLDGEILVPFYEQVQSQWVKIAAGH